MELSLLTGGSWASGWVCGGGWAWRDEGGGWWGFPFRAPPQQSSAWGAQSSAAETLSAVGITVSSPSQQNFPLNEAWFFSVISSPWAAWMWCTKCLDLSLISAPTAPITTRWAHILREQVLSSSLGSGDVWMCRKLQYVSSWDRASKLNYMQILKIRPLRLYGAAVDKMFIKLHWSRSLNVS